MSLDLGLNYSPQFTTIAKQDYDDIQPYADLATINALPVKYVQVFYLAIDTGIIYKWNGVSMNPTGSVVSVTAGSSSIVVNNIDPANPTINTAQAITTSATPNFNELQLTTTTPSTNNMATSKLYVDTALGGKVSSVSSANNFLLTVGGTSTAPTILNVIGTHQPMLYEFHSAFGASRFAINSPTDFTLSSILILGLQPANRGSEGYMQNFFQMIDNKALPARIRAVNTGNAGNYVDFLLTQSLGLGVGYQFTISKMATSTVNSFTLGTLVNCYIIPTNKNYTAGTNITIDSTNPEAPVINASGGGGGEANTASNVGVAGVGIFKQKTGVNLELRNVNVASNKLSVALDAVNNEVDLDIVESNLTLNNIGGTLAVNKGGTNQTTYTNGQILIGNTTGNTLTKTTLTESDNVLITNGNGSITLGQHNPVSLYADTYSFYFRNNNNVGCNLDYTGFRINIGMTASNAEQIYCAIPRNRFTMNLPAQGIHNAYPLLTSHFCAWQIQNASPLASIRFGLGSVAYLIENWGGLVGATTNSNGLYSNNSPNNCLTCNFQNGAVSQVHQGDTRSETTFTGTYYASASFTAGDIIILSSAVGLVNPPYIRLFAYSLSGGVATFKLRSDLPLRTGSIVGTDYHSLAIPYVNIQDGSIVNLLCRRWLNLNVSSWSHGAGGFNETTGLSYYY